MIPMASWPPGAWHGDATWHGPKMAPVFRAANAALKIGAGRLILHAMHAHKAFCACRRGESRHLGDFHCHRHPCLVGSEKNLESCDKKRKSEVGFEPGSCRVFFRAGPCPRAGRRPVGPVKIGGIPGPERSPPKPEAEPGSVPVPGGVGCFRAEKLQQFFFVFFCS